LVLSSHSGSSRSEKPSHTWTYSYLLWPTLQRPSRVGAERTTSEPLETVAY
jgi:hypothetical protein